MFKNIWKGKADFVEIQNYFKAYESSPDEIEKQDHQWTVEANIPKRMSIVAPDYLCTSCGGHEVSKAIEQGNTLSQYGTIKNYWDNYVLGSARIKEI